MPGFANVDLSERRHTFLHRNPLLHASIVATLVAIFVVELFAFAQVQDVWVDESTQLSGIRLAFLEMLRWLAGEDGLERLGVPTDRMPPVSYLLDWLWLRLVGPSEFGFRLFHSALVFAGVGALATVAWRKLGPLATIVSLAFFVLSPKLIQTAVEIRAYPVFFAVTCAQIVIFLRLAEDRNEVDLKMLALFSLVCLAAIYTHFYGVVSSSAFFFALALAFVRYPTALIAIVVAFTIVAIASSGMLPFVSAAAARSGVAAITDQRTAGQYAVYLLKLFGDSGNMISIVPSVLFFAGSLALFSASIVGVLVRARNRNLTSFDWLLAVVASGVCATVMASFAIAAFDVLSASYNCWLFAPLGLLMGVGATMPTGFRPWDFVGRIVAIGAMLIGAALSTFTFSVHASMFVHGPNRFIGSLYEGTEVPKAIVYEDGAAWGFSYFPLVFSHNGDIAQYRSPENGVGLIRIGRGIAQPQQFEAAVAPYRFLLLVDVKLRSYRDLRQCLDYVDACPRFAAGTIESVLTGTGQWQEIKVGRSFGLYDTQAKVFQKRVEQATPTTIGK